MKMALGMEVDIGPGHSVLGWDSAPLPKRGGAEPSQFSAHFCCGQMAGCMKIQLGMEVDLSPGDFVCLSVTLVYCGQTVGPIKMKLGTQVGLDLGHIVTDEDTDPPRMGTASPQFSAHVRCGQTAGCHLVWR